MFKSKIQIIFLALILGFLSFILSQKVIAKVEEPIFYISLNFQKLLKETLARIIPFAKDDDPFREKYYQLLQELAKLKMELKNDLVTSTPEKYFQSLIETTVLKSDSFGKIYLNKVKDINEGTIVLDKNFVLVGIIEKITDKFMIVKSVNTPDLTFKVNDLNGNPLGIARSVSNGFLEIDFVDPQLQLKDNSLVLTAAMENEIFPPGLIVARVKDVYYQNLDKKIISKIVAKTIFDIENGKVYLLK
ncbi:MAG: hypothetical protein KatS3mg093_366 [Candidatus Parcubacteria bacterium]|nr:MAG: hypothetical protein KatS3mg093_366 [Candidatus Parcubacteria bacterium]